jgi:hypothetical protein
MESYIEKTIAALVENLPGDDTLRTALAAADRLQATILDIKHYIRQNPFPTREAEKHYFKHLAPQLYGRLFYYYKVKDAASKEVHTDEGRLEAYFEQELAAISHFFDHHHDFCRYIDLGQDHLDDVYFVRDVRENRMLDCVEILMADDFCVGSYWTSWIWANLELRKFFGRRLARLRQPGERALAADLPTLEWTDGNTDMVELLYALWIKGSFNRGEASFKDIVTWFEARMRIDLGNYYNTVKEIGRRKKGISKFLDDLRDRLVHRLEDIA